MDNNDDDNSYVDLQSAKQNCQTEPEDVDDDDKSPAVSSPVTRSIAAKAAAVAKNKKKRLTVRNSEESSASSKKAKMYKSTVPSVITTDGTYYRAINVCLTRETELILSTWALVRQFRNWMQGKGLRTRPRTTSFWSRTLTIPSTTMQSTLLGSTTNI